MSSLPLTSENPWNKCPVCSKFMRAHTFKAPSGETRVVMTCREHGPFIYRLPKVKQ